MTRQAPRFQARPKEVSLNRTFQIGTLAVVALVALRLGLGYHFLYEGVWKIKHADEFTAEPFLTQAKGPLSPMFYAMLEDINGRQRLGDDIQAKKDDEGKELKKNGQTLYESVSMTRRMEEIRDKFTWYYGPSSGKKAGKAEPEEIEKFEADVKGVYQKHKQSLDEYLTDNKPAFETYFAALKRFEDEKKTAPGTAFQKERNWQTMQKLRGEARGWIAELKDREKNYKLSLQNLLDGEQLGYRDPLAPGWNPLKWDRLEQINFAVTYGLTAIGLCLVLGLCARPAALGGAAFMLFVVMTQPAWPTIYPHDPPVAGHALLVNKDFVEMLALLVIAAVGAGRWGGLDYFLHHLIINPFLSKTICRTKKEG